jgi:NAD(P)-dependent dehydrogenase (short-subunit alcohol dehydrogenase family)
VDRVKGKVAIVTGGAMGIGRASAILLAREGASVAVTDISDEQGRKTVREIQSAGGAAEYWRLDVRREAGIEKTFGEINGRFGRIDVLVNNAGISGTNKPTHELTEGEWDEVMSINLKGVFFCTKHVIPYMKAARRGSIINLSSVYALVGTGDVPPYHAAKGAVRAMTKNDAVLYARDKIRVNSLHPGLIWTAMAEEMAASLPDGGIKTARKNLELMNLIALTGEPNDVGWAVVYLASEESKFVTGSELVIDGGFTAQ